MIIRDVLQMRLNFLVPKLDSELWKEIPLFCKPDIDDCQSSPCENGGICSDKLNDYACSCIQGYTGKNCAASKWYHWLRISTLR